MEYRLWIDGKWVDTQGGGKTSVENPATGEKIAEVQDASRADVDRAVQAAKNAFYDGRWSRKSPGERSKAIWKLADLLEEKSEEFARVESENTGKPYKLQLTIYASLPRLRVIRMVHMRVSSCRGIPPCIDVNLWV
jgi:betaine-aldehyde dehydrogenase